MAASSSTAVAVWTNAAPFLTELEGETVAFLCRTQEYRALVVAVHQGDGTSFILLKVSARPPKRAFSAGEPAILEDALGSRWSGVVAGPDEGDAPGDHAGTWIRVNVPHEGELMDVLRNDSFLNMFPFHPAHQTNHYSPVRSHRGKLRIDSEAKAMANPNACRLGVLGFGATGRQIAETIADTQDTYLMAIVDNLTVNDMVMAWKSNTFSVRIYSEKTLLFKRKVPDIDRNDDIVVAVLSTREHELKPWGKLPVSYVIDTMNPFDQDNKRIVYSPPAPNQPHNGNHSVYTLIHGDAVGPNGLNLPIKYLKIFMITQETKQVIESMPEWRGQSANICFLAETDPTKRICDPLGELDLRGKDEDEQADDKEGADRLISLLSCCIRIIRRATIGGMFLMI